ncbi:MAG: hypothetical protein GEV13_14130 [Rhodospirillales bacterium]|nr:hypothetical protein [Rhodospirillales bacterium]
MQKFTSETTAVHAPIRQSREAAARAGASGTPAGGRTPELLKLDVQGYEVWVLKGAEESLPGIRVILAEVNLLDLHKGVPLLHETTGWLFQRGYVAYGICGLKRA